MYKNYFITAFRNLKNSKGFTFINILGLAIGLATSLMILQYVNHELSYDNFHDRGEDIYRVTNDRFQNNVLIQHGTITYPTIGPAMMEDFPEVEAFTRVKPIGDVKIRYNGEIHVVENAIYTDEFFFNIFTFPILAGNSTKDLASQNAIAISERLASKVFGIMDGSYQSAIGQSIKLDLQDEDYKIVAVYKDFPDNSHLRCDFFISYSTFIQMTDGDADQSWEWSDFWHYLLLKPGTDAKKLESKFPDFSERHFKGNEVSGSVEKFYLQPLKDTYLYSDYEYEIATTSDGQIVWALMAIAFFILMIAWINYINLTTSKALERAKEVGIRKVMGANKRQLVSQFMTESLFINFAALFFGITLIQMLQTTFNNLIGVELSLLVLFRSILGAPTLLLALIMVLIAGVILSGIYPAFILSSYRPVTVLKGKFQRSSKGILLRKALVIFQFTSSVILISATFVIDRQLHFINHSDLGLNIDNTLVVRGPDLTQWDSTFISKADGFKAALENHVNISKATTSNHLAGHRLGRTFSVHRLDSMSDQNFTTSFLMIDHDFIETYDIKLLAGRDFEITDHNSDFDQLNTIILNEVNSRLLGFKSPEDAINKEIEFWNHQWRIIGVVNNFHQESLKNPMEPTVFMPSYGTGAYISIKTSDNGLQETLDYVKSTYDVFFPGNFFEYFFLKDQYQRQYIGEIRFAKILRYFTGLAIFVACLGLFGLSSFTVLQRTKEIGIRKVLGANLQSILKILSLDFLKPILVAGIIAIPFAIYGINLWLQGFAYHISIHWWYFVIPVMLIILIAIFTISLQTIKAAITNPINVLRQE